MRLVQLPAYSYSELKELYHNSEQSRWKTAESIMMIAVFGFIILFWAVVITLICLVNKGLQSPTILILIFPLLGVVASVIFFTDRLTEKIAKQTGRTFGNVLDCDEFRDLLLLTKAAEELSLLHTDFTIVSATDKLILEFTLEDKPCTMTIPHWEGMIKDNFLDFSVINNTVNSYRRMYLKEIGKGDSIE